MPFEDDPLGAAKLVHHERPASVRPYPEAAGLERSAVLLDDLRRHDRPGGVRHLAEGRHKRAAHLEGKGVRVWRLQRCSQRRSIGSTRAGDAEWKAPIRRSDRGAAADEALFTVFGGQFLALCRVVVLGLDFYAAAQGEDELGAVVT